MLDDKEKKELGDWRKSPAGEAAMKKSREDAAKKRQPKSGGPGNDDSNDNTAKRQTSSIRLYRNKQRKS